MKKVFYILVVLTSLLGDKAIGRQLTPIRKKKEIIKLIQTGILNEDQMAILLPQLVNRSIAMENKEADTKEVITKVKKQILSETFLEQFIGPFDETFTRNEITALISYYESEAMKKFQKVTQGIAFSIYPAMTSVVSDILKPYPASKQEAISVKDKVTELTKANYLEEIQNFDGSIIIDVYSPTCGPCKTVAPIFSELSNELSDKVKFVKLNMAAEPELGKKLGIRLVPSFLFVKEGRELERVVGAVSKEELNAKIKEFLF